MNNSGKLMIAVVAASLIASVGQTAPNSSGGGQTTGQPAAPGAVLNGTPETKDGKNAVEEPVEQSKPTRTGEAQPNESSTEWRENRTEGNKATNGATEERRLEQNRVTKERERDKDRNRATTGQGAAPTK